MLPGESFAFAAFFEGVIVGPMPGGPGGAGFLVGVEGCVLGVGPTALGADDWSARPPLPGVVGKPTGGRVGVTGACWGILHGESDAGRDSAGKLAVLGGVLRKGA